MSNLPPDDAIVEEYIRAATASDGGESWAMKACILLCMDEPERAWRIIHLLIERAPVELVPAVGVGELECFLRYHAAGYIGLIEQQANASPRFRLALSGVWLSKGTLPLSVENRLLDASGGKITLLDITDEDRGSPVTGS